MSEINPYENLDGLGKETFKDVSPENHKIEHSNLISDEEYDRFEDRITGVEGSDYSKEVESDFRGGRFGDMPAEAGKDRHHIPADGVNGLERNDGPCIQVDNTDHRQTASFGSSKEAKVYREQQRELINEGRFEDAMKMDIEDMKEKFGGKYDTAISEMLDYYKTMA